jgi:hypothetical protein
VAEFIGFGAVEIKVKVARLDEEEFDAGEIEVGLGDGLARGTLWFVTGFVGADGSDNHASCADRASASASCVQ